MPNGPDHREVNHALVSFLLLNLLAGCAAGMLQLAVPLYAVTLKASPVQLGLVAGLGGVGRLLVILPTGTLVDRWGARQMFLGSTLLTALTVLALLLVARPVTLMLVTVMLGIMQSTLFLSLQTGFLKRLPYLRPEQAGWQRAATQVGFFLIGPLLGGLLLRGDGFDRTFWLVAVLFVLCLGISLYRRWIGVTEMAEQERPERRSELARFRLLLGDRIFQQILALECLGSAAFMIFRAFIGPVGVDILHYPVQLVSWLIISQGGAAMAVLLFGNRLLRRRTPLQLFVGSGLLLVSGAAMLYGAGSLGSFWVGTVIFGLGTGAVSLTSLSRIGSVRGEKGKIAALFSFSIALGNTCGPILAGCIGDLFTMRAAFLTCLPLVLLSSLLVLLFRFRQRRKQPLVGLVVEP